MTSKITKAKAIRAPLLRKSDYGKLFKKDWEKLANSGVQDMKRLRAVMTLLIENDAPLDKEWKDHGLVGEWADHRECHAKGDLLLIYQLRPNEVIFVRAGTHSELFGK